MQPLTHLRGRPGEPPLLDQEVVDHGSIGEPSGGTLSCRAFVLRSGEQEPEVVTPTGKRPDQAGFPEFHLTGDPTPELV